MKLWNSIEQIFKHKILRFMETFWGLTPLEPSEFSPTSVRRILIVRQHDQLGDFLLSTPAFRAVRSCFPQAHIAVVARKYTAHLMEHHPAVNQVITFYENGKDWDLRYLKQLWRALRSGYDLAIVLNTVSHSLTSDLIARLSGARYIVGSEHLQYAGTGRNFFYNIMAPFGKNAISQSQRNIDIVRVIGCTTGSLEEEITLTDLEQRQARAQLRRFGWRGIRPLIAVHPGAGKISNRWPLDRFALACEKLYRKYHCAIFVTWGPDERELGEKLMDLLTVPFFSGFIANLRSFAAALSQAQLLLCNDTGVMHTAAAVATPLVAIFGPTDPLQWKPVGKYFVAIRGSDQSCQSVAVSEVVDAASKLLDISSSPSSAIRI